MFLNWYCNRSKLSAGDCQQEISLFHHWWPRRWLMSLAGELVIYKQEVSEGCSMTLRLVLYIFIFMFVYFRLQGKMYLSLWISQKGLEDILTGDNYSYYCFWMKLFSKILLPPRLLLLLVFDTGSQYIVLGRPGTHDVDQTGLKLIKICMPLPLKCLRLF